MNTFLIIWLSIVALAYGVMLCDFVYYNKKARLFWKTIMNNIVEEED
ncbi:MAG: hypothetical protein UHL07_05550 [Bacteroidaceae bacterium]|nr:hypothetical protein [Bacteroidaceae bacterium]